MLCGLEGGVDGEEGAVCYLEVCDLWRIREGEGRVAADGTLRFDLAFALWSGDLGGSVVIVSEGRRWSSSEREEKEREEVGGESIWA